MLTLHNNTNNFQKIRENSSKTLSAILLRDRPINKRRQKQNLLGRDCNTMFTAGNVCNRRKTSCPASDNIQNTNTENNCS